MITSKKLSDKRIAEIKAFKNTDFSDCPVLTEKQLKNMRPRYPELYTQNDESVRISLDADIVVWLKSFGQKYDVQVNNILRTVMSSVQ